MAVVKQTHNLGKIKKLIDLNGDSINFDLSFTVTCKDDTPFNLLVVDQSTLDNGQELVYKEAKNTISGNILADKNMYQNYFLILKSETPCDVEVEILKKDLPKTQGLPPQGMNPQGMNPQGMNPQGMNPQGMNNRGMNPQGMNNRGMNPNDPRLRSNHSENMNNVTGNTFKFNWTHILIGVICVGGLILLFYMYKQKDTSVKNQLTNKEVDLTPDLNKNLDLTNSAYKGHIEGRDPIEVRGNGEGRGEGRQFESSFKPTLSYGDKINKYASENSMPQSPYNIVDRLNKFSNKKF
jgi:hypothetical protein